MKLTIPLKDRQGNTTTLTGTASISTPSSTTMKVGACVNVPAANISSFNTANQRVGPLKVRRSFNTGLPASFQTSSGASDAANGYESFVSWKPPNGDVAGTIAGKFDVQIKDWAQSVPNAIYATSYHEPENDMTGTNFVNFQRKLYDVVKAANPKIQWGPVHMSYWWQAASRLPSIGGAAVWDVGDGYRDYSAVDNYCVNPIPLEKDPEFRSWYDYFVSHSTKPLYIAEYGQYAIPPGGTTGDPAKEALRAQVIEADRVWLKTQPRVQMWLYWYGTGAQGNWSFMDAESIAAWKKVTSGA